MLELKRVHHTAGHVKAILDSAKTTLQHIMDFDQKAMDAEVRKDPHRFDGYYQVIKEAADAGKGTKHLAISIDLTYPACDIYSAKDTIDFLNDSIQDFLNANLSDGDDRLKLETLTVSCENNTITYK